MSDPLNHCSLQVHYQLHTCALKYLLRETKDELEESEPSILNVISQVQQLPLGRVTYPDLWEWVRRLVSEARGIRVTQEESPGELSSGGLRGSSLTIPVTPPLAPALPIAVHPAKTHVPPPPGLLSSEQLKDLMDTNIESEVNKMDTNEAPEQQPTTASVGNDNGGSLITRQASVVLQPEPQRTIEDSLMEAVLKESEQSIHTGSSLSLETLKPASPPPKPASPPPKPASPPPKPASPPPKPASPLPKPVPCIEHVNSNLLQQCIYGIAVCAVRCPAHFKSRYRLAAVLAKIGQAKVNSNLRIAIASFPGPTPSFCRLQ